VAERIFIKAKKGSLLKKEWAYMNFCKEYCINNEKVCLENMRNAWNIERKKRKNFIFEFFEKNYS
jgi:hypothetical protein